MPPQEEQRRRRVTWHTSEGQCRWEAASTFGATLDEQWEGLPPMTEVVDSLKTWGIYDDKLNKLKMQERFVRFQGVTFGRAPQEAWPRLRGELLEFEHGLACRQGDVGLVKGFVYDPGIKPTARVFHKPTPLPPEKRRWVQGEM
jgi:hypothetical protein